MYAIFNANYENINTCVGANKKTNSEAKKQKLSREAATIRTKDK